MTKKGIILLLFSVLQGTVIATSDTIKYAPALAMRCGRATQHRDTNTGEWISGEEDCMNGSEELLDYCKKIYKGLTITNVMLDDTLVHIPHWCRVGSSPPCRGHGHAVKPMRCIVGQHGATPMEVEQGCTFHHEIDHLECFPSAIWKNTAAQLCHAKGKTMSKPSMIQACEDGDTYNGVQFLCCQPPQLSTPKPHKGKRPSNSPRAAEVSKQSSVDDICLEPQEIGNCRGSFPKWFYNPASRKCELFIYGGCGGNGNNFDSRTECISRCVPDNKEAVDKIIDNSFCGLAYDTGPCRALFRKYYYDAELGRCQRFAYGGCDGNDNRFDMEEDCENACQGYKKQPVEPSMQEEPLLVQSLNPGPVIPSKTMEFESDDFSSTTTTTSVPKTTTEITTTAKQPATSTGLDQPYTDETTLDTEHSVFTRVFDGIKKEQENRRDEAHAQFLADIAGLDSEAKSQKENELVETITAIDAEYGGKISALQKFHMEKMDRMFEQERTAALQNFIGAVTDKKPGVRRVVATLQAYVDVERKDKNHVIQHCQIAIDEEFDEGTIVDLKLRMSEIDVRISKAKTVLSDRNPSISSRIQVEVDEIIATIPETPYFEDDEALSEDQSDTNADRCMLPKEIGLCRASLEAYYFDSDSNMCKFFAYGGCGGNENRFDTMEDCENACPGIAPEFDTRDANGVLGTEIVIPQDDQDADALPDDKFIDNVYEDPENDNPFDDPPLPDFPADPDFSVNTRNPIHSASYGLNFYLMLGLAGLVVVVIVFAIIAVIRRNHTRPPTKIVVDKPRETREKELTPEEKQLLALQQNGYENPTYKLLEKQMS